MNKDLECSSEWHLARLGSFAAVVYGIALKITKPNKNEPDLPRRFWVSVPRLAEYFNRDPKTIRRAVHKLERAGFFVAMKAVPGESVTYRPVEHKEWASLHTGRCREKLATPWDDEVKDELAIWLHTASDGTMKMWPNFMRGLRKQASKLGYSDTDLRAHFTVFFAADNHVRLGRFKRFMQYLRDQSERKAEGAKA
jgi:hypothetical protein